MGELAEAGCVAFSQAEAPLVDTQVLLRAMQYAATFGHRVWLRPQDPHLGERRRRARRRGRDAPRPAGDPGGRRNDRARRRSSRSSARPASACTCAGCRPPRASRMVRAAKARRACRSPATSPSTTCTCATSTSAGSTPQCHLVPPLRGTRDRDALRAGVADGTIDVVCSDHAPVDDDAKQLPFGEAEPGATGLELLLPLTLKWAAEDNVPLSAALARVTSAAGGGPRHRRRAPRASARRPTSASSTADAHWRVEPAALREPGQEHAVPRPRGSRAGAVHARRRARSSTKTACALATECAAAVVCSRPRADRRARGATRHCRRNRMNDIDLEQDMKGLLPEKRLRPPRLSSGRRSARAPRWRCSPASAQTITTRPTGSSPAT